jgi:hypothetical protein
MAGTSVYDAIVKFVGDYGELKTGLPNAANAAAAAAGTSAGGIFGGAFGGVLKTTIGAAIGAGVGLLLKAVTQGAVELDAATRKYQADTGATMEQAKLAGQQINDLFRSNVDSYAVIGDVLSKLATDLHITGVEAQATAQEFLNFAHATGQDPVAATDALTTAIKAFRLTADQIPGLMDAIVKGHQLYGGSVSANVDTLARLAPAIMAANLNINDALGLLNLFAAAGLDASKVPLALQTALTKVHSPEQLTAMLAQIQATPDNFDRAKLAIALFGTRAGAQLADALAPGTKALVDYQVSAADAAGATNQAATEIDQGFGNRVIMAFHNAEGAMSGFAQNAQGVVDVLDVLGNMGVNILPMLGTALGAAIPNLWGKLKSLLPGFAAEGTAEGVAMGEAAAIAEVASESTGVAAGQAVVATEAIPAATAAGTGIGGALGAAATAALYLAVPVAIAGFLLLARDEWNRQTSVLGLKAPDLFTGQGALAPNPGIVPAKPGTNYRQAWVDAGLEAGAAVGPAVAKGIDQTGPQAMAALNALILKVQGQIATILNNAPVPVAKLLATFGTGLQGVWDAAHRQGHATGVESMLAMAQGIEAARSVPLDAFTTMVTMMKTALTPQAEAARLAGELTSKALVAGLRSKDPAVAAQAIAVKEAILDRLAKIAEESGPLGKKAMDALAAGMKSKDPTIRAYATAAHDAVIAELNKTPADAAIAGANTATAFSASFAAGLRAMNANLPGWLATWLGIAGSAPKGYGTPVTVTNPRGMVPAASGMTYVARDMPVYVHQGEAILPVPQAQAWRAGSGGGGGGQQVVNINGPIQIADAHDEFSLVQQLRFLAGVQA